MCLKYSASATRLLRTKMEAAKGRRIRFWKIARQQPKNGIPRLVSAYQYTHIPIGLWRSDRNNHAFNTYESTSSNINHGIHVFYSRRDAVIDFRDFSSFSRGVLLRIICVTAHVDDLVAAGKFDGAQSAVFMKVHVSKRSYNAALQ